MITRAYFWFMNFPGKFIREKGQGLVEYALILILIAFVVFGVLSLTGTTLLDAYEKINSLIPAP